MQPEKKSRQWGLIAAAVALLILTSGVIITINLPGGSPTPSTHRGEARADRPEEAVDVAREALARPTLTTCRQAVEKMNSYLNRSSSPRPLALADDQRQLLRTEFQLSDDELAEVEGSTFTLLDGHYLDACFLFRDALRSLQGSDAFGPPLPAAEQAAAAFAWVTRQVYLVEGRGEEPLPPQFTLRRGHGTALERALVFLALLQQQRLPGCLVVLPGEPPRLWACGVLVEQDERKQLLLFDPRLGLPLPGPGGKGVATLAEAQSRPEVLKQLTVDEKYPYDVTAEQAAKAALVVACPLSALAPRMGYLEDKLQDVTGTFKQPPVSVRASVDAAALLAQLRQAVGKETPVKGAAGPLQPVRVLRRFLPTEEGGTDRSRPGRLHQFRAELVPWQLLPEVLRELPGDPGNRLQQFFAQPFLLPLEPGRARDLILRGQFNEAAEQLVAEQDELRAQKDALKPLPADWEQQLVKWYNDIVAANAQVQKAAREEGAGSNAAKAAAQNELKVWKAGTPVLQPLVLGQALGPRSAQVLYLLALCKHEEAEQLQARLDRAKGAGGDPERAREAWRTAAQCWEQLLSAFPRLRPAVVARRHLARARVLLGSPDAAASLLQDLSDLTDLEKTAHLYLARPPRGEP
jgi:hypothetical protein